MNPPLLIGIDSGSTMCKAVLISENVVVDTHIAKTGWNPELSAAESLGLLLERNHTPRERARVSVTGYGREAVPFADHTFTEITCHALGGMHLLPEAQGVIDIGGQDSKVIHLRNQKVADFLMNDKCAAGTGRFLSMACETLGIDLAEMDAFVDKSHPIPINSMCAVFAESEIIGLLSMQRNRAQIMAGVLSSIAQKICQMTGKLHFTNGLPLFMTGGLSQSAALLSAIAEATGFEVVTHALAVYAGAIGACLCARGKNP